MKFTVLSEMRTISKDQILALDEGIEFVEEIESYIKNYTKSVISWYFVVPVKGKRRINLKFTTETAGFKLNARPYPPTGLAYTKAVPKDIGVEAYHGDVMCTVHLVATNELKLPLYYFT